MSHESSAAARRFFPHINLLRAFAALSVLVYHVIEHYSWESFPTGFGLIWFKIGWMSVDLFFVISGFVIGWSLIQLHRKEISFQSLSQQFLWRRGGRIIPLYIITMVAYAATVGTHLLDFSLWPHWLSHLLFLHPLHPSFFGSINGVNWSVGIEVHFYLFALLTSPFWIKLRPVTLLITGIMVAWILRAIGWEVATGAGIEGAQLFGIMVQMPLMLDEFAAGAASALFIHHYPPEKYSGSLVSQGLKIGAAALVGVAAALWIYWQDPTYWHNPWMVIFWRSTIALAFAGLIAFFLWLPEQKEPSLLYKSAFYLGDISYGIYLWHLPVILLWKPYIGEQPELFWITVLPCTLALSALSWHLLEKPMIRWSKAKSLT
jgi:peptidoglycan/LPS O-acetylase OafA/YrhL